MKSLMHWGIGLYCKVFCLIPLTLLLLSCGFGGGANDQSGQEVAAESDYKTVEWIDLLPEADLEVLLNPPDYLNNIVEGSEEDLRLLEQLASGNADKLDSYQQSLVSTNIREEFNGENIRIAGYLVPLEFESPEVVTQAFLVPYFGACIHVPPPPPNQIILLNTKEGLNLSDMYNPYWVSGEVSTTLQQNDLATSAYEMEVLNYELYSE